MNGGDFADLLCGDGICLGVAAADKAALLDWLAGRIAPAAGLAPALIGEALRQREALGTTGFGLGAAIPHARLPGLAGVAVLVARLAQPVDWGALDGRAVDLVVLLLSPAEAGADHLKALARISRTLRNPAVLAALRAADDAAAARAVLARPPLASIEAA